MSTIATPRVLTGRDRAILAAVAAGRVEMSCSCAPDLFIDGLCCCDQARAHQLAAAGLITAAMQGAPGTRVTAALTAKGASALAHKQEVSA